MSLPAIERLARCALVLLALLAPISQGHQGIDEQIAALDQRIAATPDDAALYLQRGELHRVHQDWKRAAADYRKARKLDPALDAALLAEGAMLQESGKAKKALAPLTRFIAANPGHIRAHVARARAHRDLERHREAIEDYTRAIELAAGAGLRPEYFLERARAQAALGAEHYDAALRGLDEGLVALRQPVTLQLLAIDLLLEREQWDPAIARLDAIAAQARRSEMWLLRRAEVLERAGRPDEARDSYAGVLTAIEALPATRRGNRAVLRLEEQAREALARLDGAGL